MAEKRRRARKDFLAILSVLLRLQAFKDFNRKVRKERKEATLVIRSRVAHFESLPRCLAWLKDGGALETWFADNERRRRGKLRL